jgi:hypothetical protein
LVPAAGLEPVQAGVAAAPRSAPNTLIEIKDEAHAAMSGEQTPYGEEITMSRTLGISAAALTLMLVSSGASFAQETPGGQTPQGSPPGAAQGEPDEGPGWGNWQERMREWMMGDDWGPGERQGGGPGGMMGWGGGRGPGMMWGGGMPMHSGMMPMMMIVMMDTDGNGSISYEEVEAVHRRMFNFVDKDKNGELSPDEIQAVMGWRSGTAR